MEMKESYVCFPGEVENTKNQQNCVSDNDMTWWGSYLERWAM